MCNSAEKGRETQLAEYQRIINEPDAGHNPATFDKVLPLAEFGLPEAQLFVGEYYMYHNRETGYKEQVEKWLRLSAEQHYPPAELALGDWLYYGRRTFKTDPECEQWLLQAAEQGEVRACYFLGKLAKDKGDMAEACRWLRIGADGGDYFSQKELALHYEMGKGVPYDNGQAIHWYLESCRNAWDMTDTHAAYHLAVLRGYAEEKFADATGFAAEQYTVGMQALLRGNLAEAVDHWYSSYLNGDPRGEVWHAWRMFHVIEDFDDDDELYLEEEEMALRAVAETFSKLSHPSGWFLMGYLYDVGICYMHNKEIAAEWYRKAAAAGAEFAEVRHTLLSLRQK